MPDVLKTYLTLVIIAAAVSYVSFWIRRSIARGIAASRDRW